MDAVTKEMKIRIERRGMRFLEEGREWRLSGLLYADNLVQCGELEEDLRVMVGWLVGVCKRKGESHCTKEQCDSAEWIGGIGL